MTSFTEHIVALLFDSSNPTTLSDSFLIGLFADITVFSFEIFVIAVVIRKINSIQVKSRQDRENTWILHQLLYIVLSSIRGRNSTAEIKKINKIFTSKYSPNVLFFYQKIEDILDNDDKSKFYRISPYLTQIARELGLDRSFISYLAYCTEYYIDSLVRQKSYSSDIAGSMFGIGFTENSKTVSFLWSNWDIFFNSWRTTIKCERIAKNYWAFRFLFIRIYLHSQSSYFNSDSGHFTSVAFSNFFGQIIRIKASWLYCRQINNKCLYVGCASATRHKYHFYLKHFLLLASKFFAHTTTVKGAEISYKIAHKKGFLKNKFGRLAELEYDKHAENFNESTCRSAPIKMQELLNQLEDHDLAELLGGTDFNSINIEPHSNYGKIASSANIVA